MAPLLRTSLVTTFLSAIVAATAHAQFVKFIAAAGVKIREKPEASAKVLEVARFNQHYTRISSEGGWTRVTIDGSRQGWVKDELLSDISADVRIIMEQARKAETENDLKGAVTFAERVFEAEESETAGRYLAGLYAKSGAAEKAKSILALFPAPDDPKKQAKSCESEFGNRGALFSVEFAQLLKKRDTREKPATWTGVFCSNTECKLEPVQLSFSKTTEMGHDGDEPLLKAAFDRKPLFAIAGFPKIKSSTARAHSSVPESLLKSPTRAMADGCALKSRLVSHEAGGRTISLTYNCGDVWQDLGPVTIDNAFGSKDSPALVWAGDLDGDGKTDLLIDTSSRRGEGTDLTLWLSTSAKQGCPLGEAATFSWWDPQNAGC